MQLVKSFQKKIKCKAIYAGRKFKEIMNLNEKFFGRAKGSRIVVYHGICLKDHTKFNGIFLRYDTLEKHLQFYKKYFHVVSLKDYYLGNFSNEKFNVCLTFDDGYRNNFKYVLPLMEQYKVPVTFFITAIWDAGYDILWNDFLGILTKYGPQKISFFNDIFFKRNNNYTSTTTASTLAEFLRKRDFTAKEKLMQQFTGVISYRAKKEDEDFWQQMNTAEIRQLAASKYATIGAHGYYHNDLNEMPAVDYVLELKKCKLFLERICGKEINTLAFPYGHYSREVIEAAKKIGYEQLYALNFRYNQDKADNAMQERFVINPYISVIDQMYAIVKGKYE